MILFDLDDTLLDDRAATSLAVEALAAHLEEGTSLAEYLTAYEQSWQLFSGRLAVPRCPGVAHPGIVTNGSARQQRHELARTGILERFAHVVVSTRRSGRLHPRKRQRGAGYEDERGQRNA